MKRAIVFIDGNNWYHNSKELMREIGEIDFRKLSKFVCDRFGFELIGINYYNSIPNILSSSYSKHKNFIEELKKDNIVVKLKELTGYGKHQKEKGVDILIALDIIRKVIIEKVCDACVLVSGDADFLSVEEILRECGYDFCSASVLNGYANKLRSGKYKFIVLKKGDILNCLK